jgi:hypothetical protein
MRAWRRVRLFTAPHFGSRADDADTVAVRSIPPPALPVSEE